jgi:hypothetical protein
MRRSAIQTSSPVGRGAERKDRAAAQIAPLEFVLSSSSSSAAATRSLPHDSVASAACPVRSILSRPVPSWLELRRDVDVDVDVDVVDLLPNFVVGAAAAAAAAAVVLFIVPEVSSVANQLLPTPPLPLSLSLSLSLV